MKQRVVVNGQPYEKQDDGSWIAVGEKRERAWSPNWQSYICHRCGYVGELQHHHKPGTLTICDHVALPVSAPWGQQR